MKKDRIIFFVDAYPFEEKHELKKTANIFKSITALQPSFGYSVNVKSVLFARLSPDDTGFLNEWTFNPKNGYKTILIPYFLDKIIRYNRFIKRVISKVFAKLYRINFRDIPLSLLSSMEDIGVSAYDDDYPFETVFTKNNIKRYTHTNYGSDTNAFEKLCEDLQEDPKPKQCFLAMADFDHIMHKYGMKSKEYYAEIRNVDAKLSKLWGILEKRNNSPELLLISDHGMTPVSEGIQFNVEKYISGFQKDYFYFIDATMARIWILNDKKRDEIEDWLEGSNTPGMILDLETRKKWGITSEKFGDIIFLLDDGKMFIPNFIGDLGCKAMHGYLPTHATQLGIIASTKKLDNDDATIVADDVYMTLESFLD